MFRPIMRATGTKNQFQEDLFDLVGAVPIDSGTQYLPAPNGTTGGAGFILSGPSDTILFKTGSTQVINGKEVKGTGYEVYKCGTTFSVLRGDDVYLPAGTIAEVLDENGNVVQTLNGLGQVTRLVIENAGTLTAPCNPDNVPVDIEVDFPILLAGETLVGGSLPISSGTPVLPTDTTTSKPESYEVVPVIDSVVITNPGFGFKPTDTIEIVDNKGAELDFSVNERGEVTEVRVINGGLGFNDVPLIRIESETGFNFEAVAVFNFIPLSEIDLNNITPPPGARFVSVIDCVGKIPPRN